MLDFNDLPARDKIYYQDDTRVIYCADYRDILPSIRGVSAVVTDPPYELGFMGKAWDSNGVSFQIDTWRMVRESCKSGAPLLSFGGTRTVHRIAVAIEDAGWELRDTLMWVYGQGFPKSLDISKAIDKQLGSKRKVIGSSRAGSKQRNGYKGDMAIMPFKTVSVDLPITAPTTPEAQLWNGYGTALKPAYEPIILAMNPVEGTFANNALKHGVAGLNIDECRISLSGEANPSGSAKRVFASNSYANEKRYGDNKVTPNTGRFPTNFIHDGSDEVMQFFPQSRGQQGDVRGTEPSHTGDENTVCYGKYARHSFAKRSDGNGSAARFFYCAKASRSERNRGFGESQFHSSHGDTFRKVENRLRSVQEGNTHPTVKPLALMEYLCKLVKMPEYNLVLDPFCGSGTTLLACGNLGIRSIGIDNDVKSCEIAAKRCCQKVMD